MRKIIISAQFDKIFSKFVSKNPELKEKLRAVFGLLGKDVKHPLLKTHKLHGGMSVLYACSVTYYYRLAFSYDNKYIYPHTIGSHDDIY